MKTLIAALMLLSVSAFGRVEGHIHFQKASTWVNAYYNKSLCLDGDTFRAVVRTCTSFSSGDDRNCQAYGNVQVSQPVNSTRQVCAAREDDNCTAYRTVSYYQSPMVDVKFYDSEDNLERTVTITVPNCM